MLVVPLPIFVADTEITFVYNFVAPLTCYKQLIYFQFNVTHKVQSKLTDSC